MGTSKSMLKKTKSMIFNNTGRLVPINLKFNNNEIENVKSYSYLDVNFSTSGSFTEVKHDLYKTKKRFKGIF